MLFDESGPELNLIYISGDPAVARLVVDNGADAVMVDLETLGKAGRQAGRDTWIANHTIADVEKVVDAVGSQRVIVRTDPLNPDLPRQIHDILAVGGTQFMQPFYQAERDIDHYLELLGNRGLCLPLAETVGAVSCFEEVAKKPDIRRIHVGLNDLQISSGTGFLFEPLVSGLLERLSVEAREANTAFGFGGIARLGEGIIPAEALLAEHIRLQSSAVILSRTFRSGDGTDDVLQRNETFGSAVAELRNEESTLRLLPESELEQKSAVTLDLIRQELERRARHAKQPNAKSI